MRRSSTVLPAMFALLGWASTASAQSGTIAFSGSVTSTTCDVSFNGLVGNNPTIPLPTVASTSLLAGQSAGNTPVVLTLSGSDPICSNSGANLTLNVDRSDSLLNGRMRTTGIGVGGGTSAVVGLTTSLGAPIDLTGGMALAPSSSIGGAVEFRLFAEYYADGGDATPGIFQAPLQYTISYP
ncbi:fimbrial protein [Stenotrophomonas sp. CFBP 13718]|uniref:fimbrial protein n=1 Tax=Stenotrophomonas sp. CFBP 13718 TaxID=2775304 RepID=UPI00177EB83B|nr:fimbrial protein [Stenotrophomonas sp. CFBP 13718]MBD8695611.1 type 1 fimbrial protein [Stenotrophomonas sp. CFBP 13718]